MGNNVETIDQKLIERNTDIVTFSATFIKNRLKRDRVKYITKIYDKTRCVILYNSKEYETTIDELKNRRGADSSLLLKHSDKVLYNRTLRKIFEEIYYTK